MSNDKVVQENNIVDDKLNLQDLIKMREQLDAQIESKRPSVIYEHYLSLVNFLNDNKLDIKEFFEIGANHYTAENKRKKPPISLPSTTGNERKLVVKYTDGENNWAGRGKIPNWLVAYIEQGRTIEEFLVK